MAGSEEHVTDVTPRQTSAYLSVLLVGSLVTTFAVWVTWNWPSGGDRTVGLVLVAVVASAGVLWWRCPRPPARSASVQLFLLVYVLLWLFATGIGAVRGEAVSIVALVTPLLLALVWVKPPDRLSALQSADVLAWAFIIASAVSVVLEAGGWVPGWYRGPNPGDPVFDRGAYWLPLADLLGLEGRWAGPFVHPNLAGPVGAFLLVFGAARTGARRIAFVVAGILVLLLTSSRTSLVAAAVGVSLLVAVRWLTRPSRLSVAARVTVLALVNLIVIAAVVVVNPGLSGRTNVWPQMVEMWQSSPILGVGEGGFDAAIDAGQLPGWAHHGHDVLLDAAVRTGIVGALLVLTLLVLALVIAIRGARKGYAEGLALVGMLLVAGITDTVFRWPYTTVPSVVLLLAVLMSATTAETTNPTVRLNR